MSIRKKQDQEAGVALILAMFALLLLSAIALAMVFSSNTETSISVNYRDKHSAIYGALAGLQEARDRIHPLTGDLGVGANLSARGLKIVPTGLPSTSGASRAYVLYLINPAPGETVAPWNPSNKYFDTELCHESYFVNNLGVTGYLSGRRNTLPGHHGLGPKRERLVRLVRQQPVSPRNRGCSHTRGRLPTQGCQRQQNSTDL